MSRYLSFFCILLLAADMTTVTDVRKPYDAMPDRSVEGTPAVVTIGKGQYSEEEIERCFTNEDVLTLIAGELVRGYRCFEAGVRATF
ncbi:TPA: hypothetical protein SMF37_002420 [Serratia marcescens]|nr:hypothetical protein [Serratia marcescens]